MFIVRKTVWVFRESDLSVVGDGQDDSCTWEVPPPGDLGQWTRMESPD